MGGVGEEITLLLLDQLFLRDVGNDDDGRYLVRNRIIGHLADHNGKHHVVVCAGKGVILVQMARDIFIDFQIFNDCWTG